MPAKKKKSVKKVFSRANLQTSTMLILGAVGLVLIIILLLGLTSMYASAQSGVTVDMKINGSDNPASVTTNTAFTMSWTTTGVSPNGKCYNPATSYAWVPVNAGSSGSVSKSVSYAGTFTYSIYCSDSSGAFHTANNACGYTPCDSTTITVTNPPASPPASGGGNNGGGGSAPSGGGSSGGGSVPSAGSSGGSSGSTPKKTTSTAPSPANTTQPVRVAPGPPSDFTASAKPGETGVSLTWKAPSAASSVSAYVLERSTDGGQTWVVVTSTIVGTDYVDTETQFGTQYYYRLASIGTAGDRSDYVYTQISTTSFVPNLHPASELTLYSKDRIVTVRLPVGSVGKDAVCSIEANIQLGDYPDINDYVLAAGPYTVVCKYEDGSLVSDFLKPFTVSVATKELRKKYNVLSYYSRTGQSTTWTEITGITQADGGLTDTFEVKSANVIAVMGKPHHTPAWVKATRILLTLLFIVVVVIVGGRLLSGFVLRRRLQQQQDDYYRKANGL